MIGAFEDSNSIAIAPRSTRNLGWLSPAQFCRFTVVVVISASVRCPGLDFRHGCRREAHFHAGGFPGDWRSDAMLRGLEAARAVPRGPKGHCGLHARRSSALAAPCFVRNFPGVPRSVPSSAGAALHDSWHDCHSCHDFPYHDFQVRDVPPPDSPSDDSARVPACCPLRD
jgi:hypothetical protein